MQATARKDQRRAMGDKWKSSDLTADQQAKLQEIRRSNKTQFEAILTPEQQAKQKTQGGRWGHGNHHQM
jgi:Spy/CpxP family protein refolding chaperone